MGALVLAALALHTTSATILSSFDEAKLLRVDAILVLGGGAPPAPDAQLPFVAARCKAAAALWKAAAKKPKILTLSAAVHKSNGRDASPPRLNHDDLHAIDATPARWRARLTV